MHTRLRSILWVGMCFCAGLGLLLLIVYPVSAAVRLVSFTATAGDAKVDLRWETANEVGSSGFFVQRSTQQSSGYSRISTFIPVGSDAQIGSVYTYTDSGLTNGTTYYYRLEAINTDQSSELHGPVSAVAGGAAATAAPTATRTTAPTSAPSATTAPSATRAPTQAGTNPTATTAAATAARSATARPAGPTATLGGSTATPAPTGSTTATASATLPPAQSTGLSNAYPAVSPTIPLAAPSVLTTPQPAASPTPAATATPAPSGAGLPTPVVVVGGAVLVLLLGLGGWGAFNSLRGGAPK